MSWLSRANASFFMPPQATEIAAQVDKIYNFLLVASLISFVLMIGGMIYFVFKYKRQSANDKTAYITHSHVLEFAWSFIPFLIFMFTFGWGWYIYHQMRTFPEDALEVQVFAKKWDWRFVYKSGKEIVSSVDAENKKVPSTLVVPVNRAVKLIMASEKINAAGTDPNDRPVIHSFWIPAFRTKQDVVPGRYTALWFKADKEGLYNVFCTEFCGGGHSAMRGLIKVVSDAEYSKFLTEEAGAGMSLVEQGKQIYASKACIGCHSLDGTKMVGPSFKGIWGKMEELADGSTVKVDENYIRESLMAPSAKVVKGFNPVMPPFAGQLQDSEVNAVIEFIKSVK